MSEKPPHIRHEAEFYQQLDEKTVKSIREKGLGDPLSEYIAWCVESRNELIRPPVIIQRILKKLGISIKQ